MSPRVGQTEQEIDQLGCIGGYLAVEDGFEQGFAVVQLFGNTFKTDGRCGALERVEVTEQGVQQPAVVRLPFQIKEQALRPFDGFGGVDGECVE